MGIESSPELGGECIAGDGEGTVDDDFLAEGGGDDVVMSAEWWEDIAIGQSGGSGRTSRCSPIRETPPPITMRRGASRAIAWVRANAKAGTGCFQDGGRVGVAGGGGFGDQRGGDLVGVAAGQGEDEPVRLAFLLSLALGELLARRRRLPSRRRRARARAR